MPSRNLGERKSLKADPTVGFDQQGYLVTNGDTNDIKKTQSATDSVVGVNYTSSFDETDDEILTGRDMPIIHDGYPNVLVEAGANVSGGDAIYVSQTAGIASANADPAGDGSITPTKVGNVVPGAGKDLTGADGPTLMQVDVTSNLGDS